MGNISLWPLKIHQLVQMACAASSRQHKAGILRWCLWRLLFSGVAPRFNIIVYFFVLQNITLYCAYKYYIQENIRVIPSKWAALQK